MAQISLGQLRDLWKNVSDWVKGVDTVSAPKVTVGRMVQNYWEGTVTISKTFTSNMSSFSISNDGNADLTFIINTMTITVKAGEAFDDLFDPFTKVDITTTVPYRALVRR